MQKIGSEVIAIARREKMRDLETELSSYFSTASNKEMVLCPFCQYIGKNGRPTAKVFDNDSGKTFKCFACGVWRRIKSYG